MKKLLSFVIVVMLFALIASACAPKAAANRLEAVKAAGKIIVGTSADYEPWEYMDENNEFAGADMDIMREIGKRMGVTVEFQDLGFDALVTAVEGGKVDAAIAAMAATEERKQQVDFSIVYYAGDNVVLTTADSGISFDDPMAMKDYKVGTQSGTIMYYWLEDNLIDPGLMPSENVSLYERNEQLALDLQAGRVQVAIMDLEPGKIFMNDPAFGFVELWRGPMDPEGQAIALKKGEAELKAEIDKHLTDMLAEGVIDQIIDSYGIE